MPTAVKNCFGGRGGANNESGALYELASVLTEREAGCIIFCLGDRSRGASQNSKLSLISCDNKQLAAYIIIVVLTGHVMTGGRVYSLTLSHFLGGIKARHSKCIPSLTVCLSSVRVYRDEI